MLFFLVFLLNLHKRLNSRTTGIEHHEALCLIMNLPLNDVSLIKAQSAYRGLKMMYLKALRSLDLQIFRASIRCKFLGKNFWYPVREMDRAWGGGGLERPILLFISSNYHEI